MPYTLNPHLPRLRMEATKLVLQEGWSTRRVSRHTGFNQSTIVRWVEKASISNRLIIPTESPRPHHHPKELSAEIVEKIIEQRLQRNRCAEVVHQELINQGVLVSLSSVKRTLKRRGLTKERSPWKRWHQSGERPLASEAGSLVEIDPIHVVPKPHSIFYVYTLLDVYSRWAYAKALERMNTHKTLSFVREAQRISPLKFNTPQSDHGPEFSTYFSEQI